MHLFVLFGTNLHYIGCIKILKVYAETAPANGAIWDEFRKHHMPN